MSEVDNIANLLRDSRLIVCAGPGGVGKTTTSAALGLRGALSGRKVIVLTIDPARRLANSLGLSELTNDPQRIKLDERLPAHEVAEGGELWAMMLDQEQTLDDLVARFAPDEGALERSKANNIYRLLSSALHGMQEYMALDKLHDLYTGGYFDLVVLDTPPTKNALEFLETPGRARQFFDDRVMKWFIPSKRKTGLFSKVFDGGSVVLSLLGKIFGRDFVNDLVEFFDTLSFLQEALRTRGDMIDFILRDPLTRFVIITSADARRIKEALFFHRQLDDLGQKASAFILNRVIPRFDEKDLASFEADRLDAKDSEGLAEVLVEHYRHLARLSEHNRKIVAKFQKDVGADNLSSVPLLGEDVHDLEQLLQLGNFLTPSQQV